MPVLMGRRTSFLCAQVTSAPLQLCFIYNSLQAMIVLSSFLPLLCATVQEIDFIDANNRRLTTDGKKQVCMNLPVNIACPQFCNCAKELDASQRHERVWSDIEKCIFVDKFMQVIVWFLKRLCVCVCVCLFSQKIMCKLFLSFFFLFVVPKELLENRIISRASIYAGRSFPALLRTFLPQCLSCRLIFLRFFVNAYPDTA